jgi:putative pyruvate formate lyase activating enzyme
MQPAYLETFHNSNLKKAFTEAFKKLESCVLCPRRCSVNRLKGEKGFCRTADKAKVYSFMLHHGEEPVISGEKGSGTIFFSECNMACVYCQNYEFSQEGQGARELNAQELATIMLQLQRMRAHNINLVSPTHIMPQILEALLVAIPQGLNIPIVYNTGGYELAEAIKLLDGIVDIYLPDMRYADTNSALKYSQAPGYPGYNQEAVREMQRQVGVAKINNSGIIERGLVIRHLVLPDGISGTDSIMRFIATQISPDTYISLMSQYFPCYKAPGFKEISRRITQEEYASARQSMQRYGLHNGWIQEAGGLDRFAGINIKPNL